MKNYSFIICLLGILLFGSSCSRHYYYSAQSTHHTQLSDEGEITASVAIGKAGFDDLDGTSSDKENQFQVQAAYSPIKHLAVSGSVRFARPNNQENELVTTRGFDADLAVGSYFFAPSGITKDEQIENRANGKTKSITERGYLFDAYLTYGRGSMTNNYAIGISDKFTYNRYGLQLGMYYRTRPSIGTYNASVSIGMVVRPAILIFSDAYVVGDSFGGTNSFLSFVENNNRFNVNEFTFTGQFGAGGFRLFGNVNFVFSRDEAFYSYIDNETIQAGLLIEIDRVFNLKKKK